MTAYECSLCEGTIADGAPHESWEWEDRDAWRYQHPLAPDPEDEESDDEPDYNVTQYAHPGCYRLHRLIDISNWEVGSLHEHVDVWVDHDRERAKQAEAEADGCEYGTYVVRQALIQTCEQWHIRSLRTAKDSDLTRWLSACTLGEDQPVDAADFRARVEVAASEGAQFVLFGRYRQPKCPDFSPVTGCPGHGYHWEQE